MASPELTRRLRRHNEAPEFRRQLAVLLGADVALDSLVTPEAMGTGPPWEAMHGHWHVWTPVTQAQAVTARAVAVLAQDNRSGFLLWLPSSDVFGLASVTSIEDLNADVDLRENDIETFAILTGDRGSALIVDLNMYDGVWGIDLDMVGTAALTSESTDPMQ